MRWPHKLGVGWGWRTGWRSCPSPSLEPRISAFRRQFALPFHSTSGQPSKTALRRRSSQRSCRF
eukprot:7013065-Alexandrium_andersonii.AAC.1